MSRHKRNILPTVWCPLTKMALISLEVNFVVFFFNHIGSIVCYEQDFLLVGMSQKIPQYHRSLWICEVLIIVIIQVE